MKNSVIIEKINLFRNKFYLNLIIKGILLSIFFSINGFLLIVFLEHLVWFDSIVRQFIFSIITEFFIEQKYNFMSLFY